jgi:hypothetical protein
MFTVSPEDNSVVPPQPTLYVFVPNLFSDGETYSVSFAAKNVATHEPTETLRSQIVNTNPSSVVYAVTSDAVEGILLLTVTYAGDAYTFKYRIAPIPIENRARIVSLYVATVPCEHTDNAIRLEIDGNAAAYRLDWDDGTTTIESPWPDGEKQSVVLGPGCDATEAERHETARLRKFSMRALFSDRSTLGLGASELVATRKDVRLPIELLDAKVPVEQRAPPLVVHATADLTHAAMVTGAATGGGIVVLGAFAGSLRARRRKHRTRV